MNSTLPKLTVAQTLWRSLARALVGRLGWLIGAPLLVLACGFLLLGWNLWQLRSSVAQVQARATASAQARMVDRYYKLFPTDVSQRPEHSTCDDTCLISVDTVSVFEFDLPGGKKQRVQFDSWAHDWQHNTAFELDLPLLAAEFRIAPEFLARLRAQPSRYDSGKTVWERFWEPVDDAAHWLLRLRTPAPSFVAPLRYDPQDPATALLDLPRFSRWQDDDRREWDSTVVALFGFAGVIAAVMLFPAVQLMLFGVSRRVAWAVTGAICLSLPWWAPHAQRIAPMLSDHAGAFAQFLAREFGQAYSPSYLARAVQDTSGLQSLTWELASSPQAEFLAGLDTRLPPDFDPLDHAGAYDALQASFDRQLQAMPPQAVAAVLKQLRHYQAETVWELFVPALLRIARDAGAPVEQRDDANALLGFFATDWDLPDVDVFLYRHRLDNYARLKDAPDEATRATAASRLQEANARVERQLATM